MEHLHPTKRALLQTVVNLLESNTPEQINSDQVLEISGVSKGSLYHHYQDFPDLMESALVYRFGKFVDVSVDSLTKVISASKTKEELIEGLKQVTRATQTKELQETRFNRVRILALAVNNDRMKLRLGVEQERLTEALADLFRESIERGWGDPALDPRTIAVMVQSYTMGKIVDDITPIHMDPEKWHHLVDQILERVFFAI